MQKQSLEVKFSNKVEIPLSKESVKSLQRRKKGHQRQSSGFSARTSILLRASNANNANITDILEKKEVFEWEIFKKNPFYSFFEDAGNMELITQEQLLEVKQAMMTDILNFLYIYISNIADNDTIEEASNESKNQ